MKADDLVDLVFITPHHLLLTYGMRRQQASDILRGWYNNRELWKNAPLYKRIWWKAYHWLKRATYALNYPDDLDPQKTYAQWTLGWEHVLGIYVKERDSQANFQERQIKATEELVKIQKKMLDGGLPGDEWKKNDDDLD